MSRGSFSPRARRGNRRVVRATAGWMLVTAILAASLAGCASSARQVPSVPALEPEDFATAPSSLEDTVLVTEVAVPATTLAAPGYAGLDLLYPEIVEFDALYRQALDDLRNDDLAMAEAEIAVLDSSLAELSDEMSPLATIYFQNLGSRVERLKSILQEARDFSSYVARMDSLGVISADGEIDSLALVELLEVPKHVQPDHPRYDFELVENPLTSRWVRYFTGDGRRYMELWLTRKPLYEDVIFEILDEYNLPRDLIFLAMIESGLSMKARSYANAVGPWQFISSTGRIYGLKIDWWVDERRDLEKATRAAASHLSDLYESFGSWPLAFAAYNAGVRRVERAIRRHGTRDFWRLSSLPRQTRNYVPKFMACLEIGSNPDVYGFRIPSVEALKYDVVRVDDATDLNLIAELAGVELDSVVTLNPHLKRWSTPPGQAYEIKVPEGLGQQVATRLADVPASDRVSWRRHRVRRGESLSIIAKRYGTHVTAIKQANNMRRNLIHSGQYLLIPVVEGQASARAQRYIEQAAKAAPGDQLTHIVRRGDTLGRIAKRYGVSVKQLMSWNNKRGTRIRVGERLTVHGSSEKRPITYVVRRGDTLSTIGKRHRVTVRQLMNWNRKRNTRIRVGERLRIYTSS